MGSAAHQLRKKAILAMRWGTITRKDLEPLWARPSKMKPKHLNFQQWRARLAREAGAKEREDGTNGEDAGSRRRSGRAEHRIERRDDSEGSGS